MFSCDGRPYLVAQLVGHNGAAFDGPFVHAWYKQLGIFCPARYQTLCTLQRALWYFGDHKDETPPNNFKLGTLCEYFGVSLPEEEAHDAMADTQRRKATGTPRPKKTVDWVRSGTAIAEIVQ